MKIENITWDEDTVDHISRHAVSPEEVEDVLFNDSDLPRIKRGKENRYLAYGQTNAGRFLLVVMIIANRKTRIITARDMTDKEKKFFEERKFWDKQDSTDYLDDFEEAGNIVLPTLRKMFYVYV